MIKRRMLGVWAAGALSFSLLLQISCEEQNVDPKSAAAVNSLAADAPAERPAPSVLVNVNTASAAALEALPEIGEVLAVRIISGRPYGHVDDLLEVNGLGDGKLARIREMIKVSED